MEQHEIPVFRKSEKHVGPYINAVLNPPIGEFNNMLRQAKHSILEIGCGEKPRLSWKLSSEDLWVGCDPLLDTNRVQIKSPIHSNKVILFSDIAADIPKFTPDVLLAVAPNQKNIAENKIFNDELENFLNPHKHQFFIVALDTRTIESRGYQQAALTKIDNWMNEHHFKRDDENPVLNKFSPNSDDLGNLSHLMCFAS
ncbi:MAG: hypothetical protein ABSC49_03975 [Candidatus Microgenomates bacterium]|jgi:hypothetical protein